jgi:hypothetical protein
LADMVHPRGGCGVRLAHEWEDEELGKPGAQRYREWLRSSGIADKLSLETYDGEVVVAS